MPESTQGINFLDVDDGVYSARIAVYDSMLAAPRVLKVDETEISVFIEAIAQSTYKAAHDLGGNLPYTVIREISENFIHAFFKECTVSILAGGNTIRFSDQGPGITKKNQVLEPGVTSASGKMKEYIKGVGSGFPIVNEFLQTSGGYLLIDDNAISGAIITIASTGQANITHPTQPAAPPASKDFPPLPAQTSRSLKLSSNEVSALEYLYQNAVGGPTDLAKALHISPASAYRLLEKLEHLGLTERTPNKKRIITNSGVNYIEDVRELK